MLLTALVGGFLKSLGIVLIMSKVSIKALRYMLGLDWLVDAIYFVLLIALAGTGPTAFVISAISAVILSLTLMVVKPFVGYYQCTKFGIFKREWEYVPPKFNTLEKFIPQAV